MNEFIEYKVTIMIKINSDDISTAKIEELIRNALDNYADGAEDVIRDYYDYNPIIDVEEV